MLKVTVGDLRFAWAILGFLLVVDLLGKSAPWFLAAAAPWILGALILGLPSSSKKLTGSLGALLASSVPTASVTLIGALFVLAIVMVGMTGALLLLTAGACTVVVIGAFGRTGLLQAAVRALPAVVPTIAVLGAAEFLLRSDAIASKFGFPTWKKSWSDQHYDRLEEHNVFGFRSRYEQVRRRPGTLRVLALGDSFTWGFEIGQADSAWPALLERTLGSYASQPVEVINMAFRGYTTANEAELLRRVGWQFDPDLVLIQFLVNDALPSGPDFVSAGEPTHSIIPRTLRKEGAVGSSALLSIADRLVNAALNRGLPFERYFDLYSESNPGWRQLREALQEMGDSAATRKVPIAIILFPYLAPGEWTPKTYVFKDIYHQVAKAAADAGVETIDLIPEFAAAGRDWRSWWVMPFDSHPNVDAHFLTAHAVAEYLAKRGWLARQGDSQTTVGQGVLPPQSSPGLSLQLSPLARPGQTERPGH